MTTLDQVIEICREKLASTPAGEARRVFHGRGHCYEGFEHLVVTWLPPVLHVASFLDMETETVQRLVHGITSGKDDVSGVAFQHRAGRRTETKVWQGDVPEEHQVSENSVRYWVSSLRNQNVGLFLDMAHVREWLAPRMQDAKVLNLFAYTCAFSVSAIAHGAAMVVNNDMARNSLKIGERNHEASGHDMRKIYMLGHDLFKSWKRLGRLGPYDVIIIDPPTNQRGSFVAEKHYGLILKRLSDLAAPGATVVACLNSPFLGHDFLQNQVARWAPSCRFQEILPAHPDFPERYPDRGLKVQVYRA